jgi:hypothetical protein
VRERNRRLVTWALLLGSFILIVNALFGERGYLAVIRARQEYRTLADELKRLRRKTSASGRDPRHQERPGRPRERRAPRAGAGQARGNDHHHS